MSNLSNEQTSPEQLQSQIVQTLPTSELGKLVYRHEKKTFLILAIISGLVWLLVIGGTFGLALIYVLFFYLFLLFAHSAFISWFKGNGVKTSPQQFPDLHQRLLDCCARLDIKKVPDMYVMNGDGMLNAFATRFLNRDYVILLSDVVEAMDENKPDAINFYIGHELAHIKQNHILKGYLLIFASWLPIIGAAYRRACESTCDLHGRACSPTLEDAVYGLTAISAGKERAKNLNLSEYVTHQSQDTKGFWMSFNELTSDYPWLVKRVARITDDNVTFSRNPLAYFFALFVPRFGLGGGLGSLLVIVAMIGILAAVAIPAYQDYVKRAQMAEGSIMEQLEQMEEAGAAGYDYDLGMPEEQYDVSEFQ